MYEVEVLDIKRNKRFMKKFNDKINAYNFVRKVNYSKNLKLLCITDWSYMFD